MELGRTIVKISEATESLLREHMNDMEVALLDMDDDEALNVSLSAKILPLEGDKNEVVVKMTFSKGKVKDSREFAVDERQLDIPAAVEAQA